MGLSLILALIFIVYIQANLDMTYSMGPGKLVRHMQNPSYTYDTYLISMRRGPRISSVIDKSLSYSGPSYPSLPVYIYVTVRVSNQGFSQIPKTFRESVKFLFHSRIWSLNV